MAIHISASALKDYVTCSQKVYYRIFETGEAVPSREMLMGTITHKVLEKEWSSDGAAFTLIDELCKKYNLDYTSRNSIQHFVGTYFDKFRIMVTDEDKIEKRFKVKLYDDVYLVGVFDRITRGTVIDWKTTAKPPKKIDQDIQFILYDLAYNLIYNKPCEGLYLAALSNGSLVRYSESKLHVDTLMNGLVPEFVETIRKKSFKREGLFNGACYRCPYKQICLGGENRELVHTNPVEE